MCNSASSLVGGRASGDRHLENRVARASLQFSASATLCTLQMNFSADVIFKSFRSPFPRFLSSKWCSANFFYDVFLLWPVSHPVIARKERMGSTSGIVSFRRSQIVWIGRYLDFFNVPLLSTTACSSFCPGVKIKEGIHLFT